MRRNLKGNKECIINSLILLLVLTLIEKPDLEDNNKGETMDCRTYETNTLQKYKFVVLLSKYNGKILLSRHKERTSWETKGGHIEAGETPIVAAKRELYEESGAIEFDIEPLCDYWAGNSETKQGANGMVFVANIYKLGDIPESEMAEVKEFNILPENLTYGEITTVLFAKIGC